MGIYDREYYRRDGPGFLDSFTGEGRVCTWLIAINVSCWILQLISREPGRGGGGVFTEAMAMQADLVLQGQVWRLLTYAFLHSPDIWHILFNMLALWWFGRDLETIYGHREFLAMYLAAALLGGVGFTLAYMARLNGPGAYGASAAVMAVIMICACHDPRRTVLLFWILPVPIWFFAVFIVASDLMGLAGSPGRGRVAFSAHLGGAAFGVAYYYFQWRVLNLVPDVSGWFQRRSRPQLRLYREESEQEPVAMPEPAVVSRHESHDIDEQLEAKLDAVLAKMQQSGKESLTESERQVLLRASEVYRKRRT
jgi:membrane associated rhomboid family serine protease